VNLQHLAQPSVARTTSLCVTQTHRLNRWAIIIRRLRRLLQQSHYEEYLRTTNYYECLTVNFLWTPTDRGRVLVALSTDDECQATHDYPKSIEAVVIVFCRKDLDTIAIDTLYKTIRAND
jgi:hypothetical protein